MKLQMTVDRFIDSILSGNTPLPLLLGRSDIEKIVSARFSRNIGYESLPELADPNFLFITPEKDSLAVEEVRLLISRLHYDTGGEIRLIVIDRFDSATEESANALLKTLEDGIPGVVFLLQIGSFAWILETIMSRCIPVSSDASEIRATEKDREFARKVLERDSWAITLYTGRNRWSDRAEALIFIEALRDIIVSGDIGQAGLPIGGISSRLADQILDAHSEIANTNAQPKYVLDRLILSIYSELYR